MPLSAQLLLRNVRVLRGLLLLTPESCMVKSEPSDGLFDDAWDEAAFDRSLRDRLGFVCDAYPDVPQIADLFAATTLDSDRRPRRLRRDVRGRRLPMLKTTRWTTTFQTISNCRMRSLRNLHDQLGDQRLDQHPPLYLLKSFTRHHCCQ